MGVTIRAAALPVIAIALWFTSALAQGVAQQRAAVALPASLSNAQFWTIVTEFSEDGGFFPSDNYTSNEMMIGQVAADLMARGRTGGAYLGVGPEQNFTYIAATRPGIVFIVDIRRQAVMQHLMYKAIFEMSNNRSEFIARLFSKPVQPSAVQDTSLRDIWVRYLSVQPDSALFRANLTAIQRHLTNVRGFALSSADSATIALVYDTFHRYGPSIAYNSRAGANVLTPRPVTAATFLTLSLVTDTSGVARSFLATDANYQFIRGLHSRNLIIPVVGNFGGPHALRRVGDFLREHQTVLASYYTSNVEQYLFRPPDGSGPVWREYYASVEAMPLDSSSVFIRPNGLRLSNTRVMSLAQGLPVVAVPRGTVGSAPAVIQMRNPLAVQARNPQPVQQLAGLGSLVGTVSDSATGNPLPNTRIQLVGNAAGTVTDAVGRYTVPNIAPGLYTVTARRIGYGPADTADVRVSADVATTIDFRVAAQAMVLRGIVSTGAGTFTVRGAGASPGGPPGSATGVTICPAMAFLAAVNAGRVSGYADATRCVR